MWGIYTYNPESRHDHPWDFTSTIFAGSITNQRFHKSDGGEMWADPYWQRRIKPGDEGGPLGEPERVYLLPQPIEVYGIHESYSQFAYELHITRYLQGTVTLLERRNRQEIDAALSCWPKDAPVPWEFFRPRPATIEEIEAVTTTALDTWWL